MLERVVKNKMDKYSESSFSVIEEIFETTPIYEISNRYLIMACCIDNKTGKEFTIGRRDMETILNNKGRDYTILKVKFDVNLLTEDVNEVMDELEEQLLEKISKN